MAPGTALIPQLIDQCPGSDVRRYAFELPARTDSVARARRLTRNRLACWDFSEDVCDTALLIVSELFTNAVVHTAGDHIACELRDDKGQLRIAIQDQGHAAVGPQLCRSPQGEHGRGLLLVDAVSSAWGVREATHGPGRLVWAELECHAGRPC
ncbi:MULTISPECIES: ATP-binding protein [unclassified Streptomyces]|uniref:ATP-binding protein n=1 Tax=unclassified Streptomyces TaxID=2593676 RepID=UPI002E22C11E|nr:ATP-binding protein [Streptomyces sp. NBC_01023]